MSIIQTFLSASNFIVTGQQSFTTVGTTNWTVPAGVNMISVICVGGGAGGSGTETLNVTSGSGGGSGAVAYSNNIIVIPGETLAVTVGYAGTRSVSGSFAGAAGSSFVQRGSTNLVLARGANGRAGGASVFSVGDVVANGGAGAFRSSAGSGTPGSGGGGTPGYNGVVGATGGSYTTPVTGGNGVNGGAGGGAAGGSTLNNRGGGGGGGIDIFGEGTSGSGGATAGGGGGGGSGGQNGSSTATSTGANGGIYGGGGGGASAGGASGGNGAQGAVRIIYGYNRYYPSTNTTDL